MPNAWGKILIGAAVVGVGVACPVVFPTYFGVAAVSGGITAGIAAILQSLFNQVPGTGVNLLSGGIEHFIDGESASATSSLNQNHHLTLAIGRAFAIVLDQCKHRPECSGSVHAIETLSHVSPEDFRAILVTQNIPLNAVVDIPVLLAAASREAEKTIPPTLSVHGWKLWLARLAATAGVALDPAASDYLATQLHEQLFERLRRLLKDDFENGGRAYAAFHMLCLGRLLDGVGTLLNSNTDILQQLNATAEDVAYIKAAILEHNNEINYALSREERLAITFIFDDVVNQSKKLDLVIDKLDALYTKVDEIESASDSTLATVGRVETVGLDTHRQISRLSDKVAEIDVKIDAFKIEAESILRRYLAANAELSRTITDRDAEVERIASALREAQNAADNGDSLAEAALVEVRKTGDIRLLLKTLLRITDEQYAKVKDKFKQGQSRYVERCREVALIAYLTGDIGEAESRLNTILTILPDDIVTVNRLGIIYKLRGDHAAAIRQFNRVLELAPDDEILQAVAYSNLGSVLQTCGNLDEAEIMYRKSQAIDERLGRLEGMSANYGNLGIIMRFRGDLRGAEAMYRKSLAIDEMLDRVEGIADNYTRLGNVLQIRGDLDGAEALHKKALALNEKLERLEGMAIAYANLGIVMQTRGNLDEAEIVYRKGLVIDEKLGRPEGMASKYGNLGNVLLIRGDLVGAEAMLKKALAITEQFELQKFSAGIYGNLGHVATQRKDFAEARRVWTLSRDLYATIGAKHMERQLQDWLGALPPE